MYQYVYLLSMQICRYYYYTHKYYVAHQRDYFVIKYFTSLIDYIGSVLYSYNL